MTQTEDLLDKRAPFNRRRTVAILAGFAMVVFLTAFVVFLIVGVPLLGIVVGAGLAALAVTAAWYKANDIVLELSEAEAATETEHARLFNITAGLCAAMGVAPPSLYVSDDPAVNALSSGVDTRNASLVVTSGALEQLSLVELESVVALALYRIKTGDIVPETLAVVTVGLPLVCSEIAERWSWLSTLLALPAPVVMKALGRMHSKRYQLDTDLAVVRYTRFPPALATALGKMRGRSALGAGTEVTAHMWMALPLGPTARGAFADVHAGLEERVAVLQEL